MVFVCGNCSWQLFVATVCGTGVAPMAEAEVDSFKGLVEQELGWEVEDVTMDEACVML